MVEVEAPALKPVKKPRRQRVVKEPVVVETPALDFYDYPFVERLVEEPADTPAPVPVERTEFHEYSFDLPEARYAAEPAPAENALAYIVSSDTRRGQRAG